MDRYKEALERAKEIYRKGYYESGDLEKIFPELAETEDEKIRKDIIYILANTDLSKVDTRFSDMLAYLEKQGDNSNWHDGDVIRQGAILAIVISGRRAIKLDGEKITIQYPNEWVKAQDEEREYFFEKLIEKQKQWKPTEEQMTALLTAIGDEKKTESNAAKILRELYNKLKQL